MKRYVSITAGELPLTLDIMEPAFIGDFSVTLIQTKRRIIEQSVALYPFQVPQSPTELIRDYLASKYSLPVPIMQSQVDYFKQPQVAPLMAICGNHGECEYIDIRAAYWQIVKNVGWDVDYMPKKWLAQRSDMSDCPIWLSSNKPARASMVSLCRPSAMTFWTGDEYVERPSFNKYLNSALASLVADVLASVASDICFRVPSVRYVNTDGYIVHSEAARQVKDILEEWGLNYRVKGHGETWVNGVGSYKCGKLETDRKGQGMSFDNVEDVDVSWLKKRFSWFMSNPPQEAFYAAEPAPKRPRKSTRKSSLQAGSSDLS